MDQFLTTFGIPRGGTIRYDEGEKLVRSSAFRKKYLDYRYVCELMGADTPEQNGAVECFNDTLATKTRALLYGSAPLSSFGL